MNITSLREILANGQQDPRGYKILEEPDENTWCLRKQGKTWLVFYFERGTKWELQRFKTESAACEYFLNRVTHG